MTVNKTCIMMFLSAGIAHWRQREREGRDSLSFVWGQFCCLKLSFKHGHRGPEVLSISDTHGPSLLWGQDIIHA